MPKSPFYYIFPLGIYIYIYILVTKRGFYLLIKCPIYIYLMGQLVNKL